MLLSLAECKALLAIEGTAHDAYVSGMIGSAQQIVEGYLQQPVEQRELRGVAPCAASATSEYGIVVLPCSIDVQVIEAYSAGDDITSYCIVDDDGIMHVPTDYIGYMVAYRVITGWTPDTVPDVVRYTLARIVWHMYRQTGLAAINTAGVRSLSTSDGGVVTSSRTYEDDELTTILRTLDQWRRL